MVKGVLVVIEVRLAVDCTGYSSSGWIIVVS